MPSNHDAGAMPLSRRRLLAGAAASVAAAPARAAGAAYPRLRRGINIHHLLNWPDARGTGDAFTYVWPPFQGPRFEISDVELRRLTDAGFDFVRLTVDPSIFMTASPDRAVTLERHAKSVVDRLLGAGLNVVFDLHPVAVNPAFAPLKLVESEGSPAFQAYAALVGRAAGMLRGYPADRVALELMNEPLLFGRTDVGKWQSMLEHLHGQARARADTLALVLTGASSSYRKALEVLNLAPFRGSNVLYTFHFYEPYPFTHQGVPRIEPQFISGLAWPEEDANARDAFARARAAAAAAPLDASGKAKAQTDTDHLMTDYLRQRYDAATVAASLDGVARWARSNAIEAGRLLLGEFGCVDAAGGRPTGDGRLAWLRAVAASAERNGIAWAYWAYKGNGGMQLLENGRLDKPTLSALIATS